MYKEYPRIRGITKLRQPCKKLCSICKNPAVAIVCIQNSCFRGDDDVENRCKEHIKTIKPGNAVVSAPAARIGKERKSMTFYHISTNIEGLLRECRRKKINFLQDDNGRTLSDKEARAELARLQSLGHKLFGASECEGFDPFGGGCPGHEKKGKANND